MTKANTGLNGLYTAIGRVIEGMDVVHKIEEIEVKAKDDEVLITVQKVVQHQKLVHQ